MNQHKKLYSKQHDSYCTWNGVAYENDGKVPGAYFYGLEKAKNCGFEPIEEQIMKDLKTTMLKAIMERYGSLSTLKQALYEDTDTVLVNLCDDTDDVITEEEFSTYFREIL